MSFANPNSPNLPDFWVFIRTGMQVPQAALPGPVGTPAAPGLTAGSGGSLPSGTLYAKVTCVSAFGETLPSAEASVAVTGPSGQVTVTSPAATIGATGYNVYAASTSGAETLQNSAPVAIGTAHVIDSLAVGAAPPTVDTSGSPWPGYAFAQAINIVLNVPCVPGLDYTLAVYNYGGHLLLQIAPDQPGQIYFSSALTDFGLLRPTSGVVQSAGDQGTSSSYSVPSGLSNLTIGDLNFFRTPYGRAYLSYAQDFGSVWGLT